MKKFDKNDMVFYFQQAKFPEKLICKDVLIHRDLIFNDDDQEPEIILNTEQKKKNKFSSCFIIEDELESSKNPRVGGFNKRGGQQSRGGYNKPKPRDWRENKQHEEPASSDFFDEFKGQTDKEKVTKFKVNLHLGVSMENSITIDPSGFIDHANNSKGKSLKFYEQPNDKKGSDKINNDNNVLTADNFFDNADKIMGTTDTITPSPANPSKKANESICSCEEVSAKIYRRPPGKGSKFMKRKGWLT